MYAWHLDTLYKSDASFSLYHYSICKHEQLALETETVCDFLKQLTLQGQAKRCGCL